MEEMVPLEGTLQIPNTYVVAPIVVGVASAVIVIVAHDRYKNWKANRNTKRHLHTAETA